MSLYHYTKQATFFCLPVVNICNLINVFTVLLVRFIQLSLYYYDTMNSTKQSCWLGKELQ